MRPVACALIMLGVGSVAGRTVAAQADPRLVAAVRQAQEGGGDSARATLRRLIDSTPSADPFFPQVLYAAAVVAPTASEMQRTLQRITVEHPLSMWADDALLKLAQLEYAGGNLPGTVRHLERLRSDFPASPVLGTAAFWAARTYFDMREERTACRWIGAGIASLRPDEAELGGRLRFFSQRCPATLLAEGSAGVPAPSAAVESTPPAAAPAATPPVVAPVDSPRVDTARADTARAVSARVDSARVVRDTTPTVTQEPPQPAGPVFRVQVVAAATRSMADEAVQRLRSLGVPSRIVSEGPFLKVRAGSFADRAQAAELLRRLRGEFPGAFIVSDP